MALGVEGVPAGRVVLKTALLTLGTVGFVFFLTLMFEAMRAVMDVGGTCASGGPFEIRQQCPEGTAWMIPVAIFGGLASLGIGAVGVFREGGPRPYVFAWSALFLALGWNFLEYAFDPPGGGGLEWGWLVCGVVFVLMGGVPLLGLLAPAAARWALWGPTPARVPPGTERRSHWRGQSDDAPPSSSAPTMFVRVEPAESTVDASSSPDDVVSRLERLAVLHDRGAIDDAEYEAAKDAVLGDEAGR